MSYLVSQQSREIGIRMALGAEVGQILRSVLGRGLGLTLLGVALGLAGGIVLARFMLHSWPWPWPRRSPSWRWLRASYPRAELHESIR